MIPPYIPWWLFLDDDEEEELFGGDDDLSLFGLILEEVKEDWKNLKIKIKKFLKNDST